jgi:tetratricopeptide (TPR) repeat protein
MAKKRRVTPTRPPTKKTAAKGKAAGKSPRPAVPPVQAVPPQAPEPASPVARKPAYYEAIALYEGGVRALQKHDFQQAGTQFKAVLDRYPEERELHERARLYLRVCERETARRPSGPQTPEERVYAATMALNAHYIMAVALTVRSQAAEALEHLRKAVSLNPENRSLALQDPDLEPLRSDERFEDALDAAPAARRRAARPRNTR